MEDEFKLRYSCPCCGARTRIKSGHCPKCGYIGAMEHKDIRLRGTNNYGITITVEPPIVPGHRRSHKPHKVLNTLAHFICPHCGTKTSETYGTCPNRSCGYTGTMKPRNDK